MTFNPVGEIIGMLASLPPAVQVFLLAMLPFTELRLSIPVGIGVLHMDPLTVFLVSVAGNILPVPIILAFFGRVERFLRRFPFFDRLFDRLFDRTFRRAKARVLMLEEIGLVAFVAIPLPVTGAWTGSLIAYIFDLDLRKSLLVISAGVIIAGLAVTAVVLLGIRFLGVA